VLSANVAALNLPPILAGRFRILGQVGQGGIAQVVRAFDETTQREVALKVMFPNLRANAEVVSRFKREVAVVQRVNHPLVVPILEVFEDETYLFLSMPLMAGDLQQWLCENGALPPAEFATLAQDLCAALNAAHQAGVVHRDIKPLNILRALHPLEESQRFFLSDFGLARTADFAGFTTSNTLLGTPEYMAPEVASEGVADPRSDVYSLAVVLYEAATGRLPFVADTPFQMLHQHLTAVAPSPKTLRPGLPASLCAVLLRGLAKEPTERFNSAALFGKAIADALQPGAESEMPAAPVGLQSAPNARCAACGYTFVRELGICTRCGHAGLAATVGKGKFYVTIPSNPKFPKMRSLDTATHTRLLKAIEGVVVDRDVLRKLQGKPPKLPLLLAAGIDRASADLLVQAVSSAGLRAFAVGWYEWATKQQARGLWGKYFFVCLGACLGLLELTRKASLGIGLPTESILVGFLAPVPLATAIALMPRPMIRFKRKVLPPAGAALVARSMMLLARNSDKRLLGRAAELTHLLAKDGEAAWASTIHSRLQPSIDALVALDQAESALSEVETNVAEAQSKLRESERLRLLVVSDVLGVVAQLEAFASRLLTAKDRQAEMITFQETSTQWLEEARIQSGAIAEVKLLLGSV